MADPLTSDLECIVPKLAEGYRIMVAELERTGQAHRIADIVAVPAPRCEALPNGGWWLKAAIPDRDRFCIGGARR